MVKSHIEVITEFNIELLHWLCASGCYYDEYANVKDALFAEWMMEQEYW